MTIFQKRAEKILKKIKPLQEDLKKRRVKMSNKKQETDRVSFIKKEIEKHANENDEKCRLFIEFHKEISKEDKSIPEKKLLLADAMDLFSQICISHSEIEVAFFEANGAEGLAKTFEALLDTAISDLLQQMFTDDFSIVFKSLLNIEDKPEPEPEPEP